MIRRALQIIKEENAGKRRPERIPANLTKARQKSGREEIMDRNLTNGEIPLGLGMAFAQNTAAMERFAAMSAAQKEEVIRMAQNIGSKAEMTDFVQKLADGKSASL